MALQRTRRPGFRWGRSLRSLGSPLNARPLGAQVLNYVVSRSAICIVVALLSSIAAAQPASPCPGFPWTVTATPVGPSSLAIHVCGADTPCLFLTPVATVAGSEIRIAFTAACACVVPRVEFTQSVVVGPLSPGQYTVTVTRTDCSGTFVTGTGIVELGPLAAVPAQGFLGVVLLALLLAAAGAWKLLA
jgi:hypothetical protein